MSYFDAVLFRAASSGTGDFVVSSAITGYRTPAAASVPNGATGSYRAFSDDLTEWEQGTYVYTSGTTTAARTVTANSLGTTAKINFTAAPQVGFVESAADLANASLLTSGTLPIARLNGGTANQLAQGDGSFITNTRKLLNTLTASASASLNDTSSFGNTVFNDFEIVLEDVVLATASQELRLQVRSGGTFQTSSYLAGVLSYNGGGPSTATQNSTVCIPLTVIGGNVSTAYGISGTIRIYNVQQTTQVKMLDGRVTHLNIANSAVMFGISGGWWNNSAALDGFRIISSSGNLTRGVVKVYGL